MAKTDDQVLLSDPNFPLVRLPSEYDSHRSTNCLVLSERQEYKLIDAKGPGCVRHFSINTDAPDGLEIEVTCYGAGQSHIKMKMQQFFGVLLGKQPYRIESAPIKLLPRYGYNSYFPIFPSTPPAK